MPDIESPHECDLFLLSSHTAYTGERILPEFARHGCGNLDGWGLGYYDPDARIVRRATPAIDNASLSQEFATAVEVVSSPLILGHLRRTTRGRTRVENNHPFRLDFLGYQWLLVHNGTATRPESLVRREDRLLTASDNDTPRVFEFLRQQIIDYCSARPQHSLIEACRQAYSKLLATDPGGKFNLVLSNGHLSFVFIQHRPFYMLYRPKETGGAALVSTLKLTEHEVWIAVERLPDKKAKMLVFNGPTLVANGDVAE